MGVNVPPTGRVVARWIWFDVLLSTCNGPRPERSTAEPGECREQRLQSGRERVIARDHGQANDAEAVYEVAGFDVSEAVGQLPVVLDGHLALTGGTTGQLAAVRDALALGVPSCTVPQPTGGLQQLRFDSPWGRCLGYSLETLSQLGGGWVVCVVSEGAGFRLRAGVALPCGLPSRGRLLALVCRRAGPITREGTGAHEAPP